MDKHIKQKIFGLIQKDLNADPSKIDPDKPIRDQVGLDSMQFVGVVARIELELGVELPISVIRNQDIERVSDGGGEGNK